MLSLQSKLEFYTKWAGEANFDQNPDFNRRCFDPEISCALKLYKIKPWISSFLFHTQCQIFPSRPTKNYQLHKIAKNTHRILLNCQIQHRGLVVDMLNYNISLLQMCSLINQLDKAVWHTCATCMPIFGTCAQQFRWFEKKRSRHFAKFGREWIDFTHWSYRMILNFQLFIL